MAGSPRPSPPHQRWVVPFVIALTASALVLVLGLFTPYHLSTTELEVASSSSAATTFVVSSPSYVTVHVAHRGTMTMEYQIDGPGGMSQMGSMMSGGGGTYSFLTWGGEFHCQVAMLAGGYGMTPVWVNVTWGLF